MGPFLILDWDRWELGKRKPPPMGQTRSGRRHLSPLPATERICSPIAIRSKSQPDRESIEAQRPRIAAFLVPRREQGRKRSHRPSLCPALRARRVGLTRSFHRGGALTPHRPTCGGIHCERADRSSRSPPGLGDRAVNPAAFIWFRVLFSQSFHRLNVHTPCPRLWAYLHFCFSPRVLSALSLLFCFTFMASISLSQRLLISRSTSCVRRNAAEDSCSISLPCSHSESGSSFSHSRAQALELVTFEFFCFSEPRESDRPISYFVRSKE